MRLAFVTESLNQYRLGWFEHLSTAGFELTVVHARVETDRPWDSGLGHRSYARRCSSLTLGPRNHPLTVGWRLSQCLASYEPEILIVPGWSQPLSFQAGAWCRRYGVPYGVLYETWKPHRTLGFTAPITDPIRRSALRRAAVRLPVGQRAAEYTARLGFECHVVHANVCDVRAAGAAASMTEPSDGPIRALYCGRFVATKGVDLVLRAAARRHPDIEFSLMGAGQEEEAVKAAASSGQLRYLGPVSGQARFEEMARADVLVLPSRSEPWGVVVHEALAAGTPVVVSSEVGCLPEMVEAGVTGEVIPPEAEALLGAALEVGGMARSTAVRKACMERAARYTYETATEELRRALDGVSDSGNA